MRKAFQTRQTDDVFAVNIKRCKTRGGRCKVIATVNTRWASGTNRVGEVYICYFGTTNRETTANVGGIRAVVNLAIGWRIG